MPHQHSLQALGLPFSCRSQRQIRARSVLSRTAPFRLAVPHQPDFRRHLITLSGYHGELTPALIEFENVSIMRGETLALNDISLRIGLGEHVAILGPNGCGKSTLIKTITRECYPLVRAGSSVRILGRDQWNVFELRKLLGIVSSDLMTTCTRDATGRDIALSGFFSSIGIWPHQQVTPEMHRKAEEALAMLDVAHLADRFTDEMSSAEARRG